MTRVDFYVLQKGAKGDRFALTCRLAETIFQQKRRIYVHMATADDTQHLDRLLWTYRQGSFLPHGVVDTSDADVTPILIGNGGQAGNENDVLINLGNEIPAFFSRFDRVAEIIDHDDAVRARGREHFRFYRDRGYPMHTHELHR